MSILDKLIPAQTKKLILGQETKIPSWQCTTPTLRHVKVDFIRYEIGKNDTELLVYPHPETHRTR